MYSYFTTKQGPKCFTNSISFKTKGALRKKTPFYGERQTLMMMTTTMACIHPYTNAFIVNFLLTIRLVGLSFGYLDEWLGWNLKCNGWPNNEPFPNGQLGLHKCGWRLLNIWWSLSCNGWMVIFSAANVCMYVLGGHE